MKRLGHLGWGAPVFGLALGLIIAFPAAAAPSGVVAGLSIEPATVQQGDPDTTVVLTRVTLQAPSPDFFICQVRSDNHDVTCSSIIFKKGDTEATGKATINWANLQTDTQVILSAFNIESPDKEASATLRLQTKADASP
jgi:hypothetical protein